MRPREGEPIYANHVNNAFIGTELERALRALRRLRPHLYDGALFVGILHAPERVLFVTAGQSRDTVLAALAEWALGQARRKLRGRAILEVERLTAARMYEKAVETYLRHVAETWDPEWVAVRALRVGSSDLNQG